MQMIDLGPLERAVLKAVLHAELAGAAVPATFIWRTLPGYETHLANVETALSEGLPLRGWLSERGGLFCARDRAELPRGVSAARRRGEARWHEVRELVVGLGKLPWVEAVAVVGPMAWGLLPSICDPCPVAIVAEGGRADLARAAVQARLRSAGELGESVQLAHTFDGDAPAHPELGVQALLGADFSSLFDQRWAELGAWVMQDEPGSEPEPTEEPEVAVVVQAPAEPEAPKAAKPTQVELPLEAPEVSATVEVVVGPTVPTSRRQRGAARRPPRQRRSAAAGQGGQRHAGAGRKRRG